MIDCVVSPELHILPVTALDIKVNEPPEQKVVGPPALIVTPGNGFTITFVLEELAVHPFTFVAVTL